MACVNGASEVEGYFNSREARGAWSAKKGEGDQAGLSFFPFFSFFSFERITYTGKVIDCEGSL